MTNEEFYASLRGCSEFLNDHHRRSVRERMEDIAQSTYAELPNDRYGQGGMVGELERETAELLGKEAAVFMPSGTMAQQIALRIWSDRSNNRTVAFHPLCHLEVHEHMAYREIHHLEAELLGEADRLFTIEDLRAVAKRPSSVLIELPQREIGGQLPTWDELRVIAEYAKENGIRMHLDGARLWECQPHYGRPYQEIVADFDSVYVSFYKVLFGLAGAALAGPAEFIAEARIWLRRHGGNLVNMVPNAVSAKIGLDLRLPRIASYVQKASEIAAMLDGLPGITVVPKSPPTNMMHVHFDARADAVRDAIGQIALQEKCALLFGAQDTERGSKAEVWIGDAGLDIPNARLRGLFTQLSQELS